QVTLIKTTFLDLKMLGDMPSIEDLPISPLFGMATGPCSTPPRSQDGGSYFTLSHKTYSAITGTYVVMDIPCLYDPDNSRHSNVANTTNSKAIFPRRENCSLARISCKILHLILNGRIRPWKEPPPMKEAKGPDARS
ncbi:6254_t:CDS:1, partial [Entrophospora sp. SA101]